MTMQGFDGNIFRDFLEQQGQGQQANYFSFGNQFGSSPNQQRYFRNRFSDIQDQYMGMLGSQIRSGQMPTLRFNDFLSSYPFQQTYQQLTPIERRDRFQPLNRFNPATGWDVNPYTPWGLSR